MRAKGTDVFVGPQTASIMAGLKKALATADGVVTLTGPAGSGKTTLACRALDAMAGTHRVLSVGRMRLDSEDVIDFLLEQLNVTDAPKGVFRRFARLRERLRELENANFRTVIVIEDAPHLGVDTLGDIEALTAADAGLSRGAAIVLMGHEGMDDILQHRELTRLSQRVRHKLSVQALSASELRGYLMHCFRIAGNEFESIFDARCAGVLHQLSNGIPRVVNTLVEASMEAAEEAGEQTISAEKIAAVAEASFGLRLQETDTGESAPVVPARPEETAAETPDTPSDESPVIVCSDAPAGDEIDDLPELIPDTEQTATEQTKAESTPEEIPAWERDPTVEELCPDLDALEKALAGDCDADEPAAQIETDNMAGAAPEVSPTPGTGLEPATELVPEPEPAAANSVNCDELPEITLDNAIRHSIGDEAGEQPAGNADNELERIASELAKAKTLEDVDDKLAETLFGEELNLVAAEVIANGSLVLPESDEIEVAKGVPVDKNAPAEESAQTTDDLPGNSAAGLSASQRLKTVRALNNDFGSNNEEDVIRPPSLDAAPPDSIEDQINTSMTQTLKALDVPPPITGAANSANDDGEEDKSRGGFFSRFKRS